MSRVILKYIVNAKPREYRLVMSAGSENVKKWGKRAGLVAFLIFLVKGLVWLGLAASAWWAIDR